MNKCKGLEGSLGNETFALGDEDVVTNEGMVRNMGTEFDEARIIVIAISKEECDND